MSFFRISFVLPISVLIFISCTPLSPKKSNNWDAEPTNSVISAAQPLASNAGKAMYAQGGNAFDAAVAAAFTLAVVEPSMSGIGGRLQAIYRKTDGTISGVDASTEVPINYTPSAEKHSYGYPTIGIPGVVAGLIKLHKEHGTLPLQTVMNPAIGYAQNGYSILPGEALRQQMALEQIQEFEGTSTHFLKEDKSAFQAGEIVVQTALAEVLKKIASDGKKGFYEGEVAKKMVDDIQANGGILTLEDLKNYTALDSRIVQGKFKEHQISSLFLPSYGAITVQILQILDQMKQPNTETEWKQAIGKATALAYEYRKAQSDPDSLAFILSYEDAGKLAKTLDSASIAHKEDFNTNQPISWTSIDGHTTHLTTADQWGNVVSLTQTVGPLMGSKVATKGLGFIYAVTLGGYLGDYKPGDRANSHISPTFVSKDDQLVLALGAAGGSRIVTAVTQVISRYIGQNHPLQKALMLPRVYPYQGTLWVENHTGLEELNAPASAFDMPINMIDEIARFGRVHAVARHPKTGNWEGAADPDWEGTSAEYPSR